MTALYQLLPDLTPDEYEALRDDIAENGFRVPVDVDDPTSMVTFASSDSIVGTGVHRGWFVKVLAAPNEKHPGYWDVDITTGLEKVTTERSVRPEGIGPTIKVALGTQPALKWTRQSTCSALAEVMSSSIYFIQAVTGGPIKIGVAQNVSSRAASIQRMSPVPLQILGTQQGAGTAGERALHQRFAASRLHGEWFQPTPELLACIEVETGKEGVT